MSMPLRSTELLIEQLVQSTGAADAVTAIRLKARELINLHVAAFGEPTPPINVDVLASLRGIGRSQEPPVHSPDAELVPDGAGGVTMRVNQDRPSTRQRFSISHEISHTFFPDYTTKEWCRTDARHRDRDDPDDFLEMLCDVGASELLFPIPWFAMQAGAVKSPADLISLATTYDASREATLRRYAETSAEALAAVFFAWKLKPTQKGTIGRTDQGNLFGVSAEEEIQDALRLRIEYTVTSDAFKTSGHYLPKDKSVENDGPIYQAALTGIHAEGECSLDLGQASGTYHVWAIPLWTGEGQFGANGENAVAAILRPRTIHKPRRKKGAVNAKPLFDDA
jgi:hypothetical protein